MKVSFPRFDPKNKKHLAVVLVTSTVIVSVLGGVLYTIVSRAQQQKNNITPPVSTATETKQDGVMPQQSERPDVALPTGRFTWKHKTSADDVMAGLVDTMTAIKLPHQMTVFVKSNALLLEKFPETEMVILGADGHKGPPADTPMNDAPSIDPSSPPSSNPKQGSEKVVDAQHKDALTDSKNGAVIDKPQDKPLDKSVDKPLNDANVPSTSKPAISTPPNVQHYLLAKLKFSSDKPLYLRVHRGEKLQWFSLSESKDGKSVYQSMKVSLEQALPPLGIQGDGSGFTLRNNALWCDRFALEKLTITNVQMESLLPPVAILDEQVVIQQKTPLFANQDAKQKIAILNEKESVTLLGESVLTLSAKSEANHAFLVRNAMGVIGWLMVKDAQVPFKSESEQAWACKGN